MINSQAEQDILSMMRTLERRCINYERRGYILQVFNDRITYNAGSWITSEGIIPVRENHKHNIFCGMDVRTCAHNKMHRFICNFGGLSSAYKTYTYLCLEGSLVRDIVNNISLITYIWYNQ